AAVLCGGRRWLRRLDNIAAGLVSYGLIILITLILSEAAYWLVESRSLAAAAVPNHGGFLLRSLVIGAIVAAIALRYLYVQHQWKRRLESEAQARIQALQSRIRPHFLFNSMNTIASLTRTRPQDAERVVEDLAELFRVSLGDAKVPVTLGRELEVCKRYVDIEALRLGARLGAVWRCDTLPEDALLPALTLQPLLENAIYHGIEPMAEGGVLRVIGDFADGRIRIDIENPASEEFGTNREGNRMAQDNVRERLEAFFPGHVTVDMREVNGEYRVCLDFPYLTALP
ncbi:MAG: sensor histidine kinase, partial [Gammaproteobacteria bacterium]